MNRITTNPLGIPGEPDNEADCGCSNLKPGDRCTVVGSFCDSTRTVTILPEATMLEPVCIDIREALGPDKFDALVRERATEFYRGEFGVDPSEATIAKMVEATTAGISKKTIKRFQFDDGTIVDETEIGTFGSVECQGKTIDGMKHLPPGHKLHGVKVVHVTDVAEWVRVKRTPIIGYAGGIDEDGKVFRGRPIHAGEDVGKFSLQAPKFVVCANSIPAGHTQDEAVEVVCSKCGGKCYCNKLEGESFSGVPAVCKTCFEAMDLKAMAAEEAAKQTDDGESTSLTA